MKKNQNFFVGICLFLTIFIMFILAISPMRVKAQTKIVVYADSTIIRINPISSAIVEVQSVTSGILIPRMTQTQRDSILNPTNGLLIYQVTIPIGFHFFDGVQWNRLISENSEGIIQYGEAQFNGDPTQEIFESVFGIRQFHFHFTLYSTSQNKVYTGAYLPGHGFFYEKLKQ